MNTPTPSPRPHVARGGVLVLGGGLAGSHVARGLDEGGATIVNPAEPRHVAVLLEAMHPDSDLVLGSAVSLDTERRLVHVETEAGRLAIAYADLVIALGPTAGGSADPLARRLGLPTDEHCRVRVDETLRVLGVPHVWALGECAAVPNEATPGQTDPPTLRHALRQARHLISNLRGTPAPYRYRDVAELSLVNTPRLD
jgi:NADH:ubiquinone reductase (H+-translocating)